MKFPLIPCLALSGIPALSMATVVQENWDYPAIADNTQLSAGEGFTRGSHWNGAEWARENVAPCYQTYLNLAPAWPGGMSGINNALQPYLQGVANTHGAVSPFIAAP